MYADDSPTAPPPGLGATWRAIAWLEGLTLTGATLAIAAALSNFCFLCGDPEPMSGGWKLALALGLAMLAGGPALAARSSGRSLWFGVGILAMIAGVLGFVLGVAMFGDALPALVLGLAAEAAVAVRPPVRAALTARTLAVLVLVLLAAVVGVNAQGDALLVLVLLAQPAIGIADTLAVALAPTQRRDAAPILPPR